MSLFWLSMRLFDLWVQLSYEFSINDPIMDELWCFQRDFIEFMSFMRFLRVFNVKLEPLRFYWVMSFHEIFLEFSSKTWVMRPLSREMSYSHETNVLSYELWVLWVMSYNYLSWVTITMHCLSLSVGIVDIAPRVSLDGIRKDSYIKSIDVH